MVTIYYANSNQAIKSTANHRKTLDKNCSSICCGVPRGAGLGRGSPKLKVDVKKPKGNAPIPKDI